MPSRDSTARDYRERINRVIFHIEAHLAEPMNLEDLARVACFSPFHFHRIFLAFTGEPLAGFIRRVRLERAAQHLRNLDDPVTDIALSAGYETPSAFTRAFTAQFGISPTEYRQRQESVLMLGARPLALTTHPEERAMSPEVRTVNPVSVLFVRRTGAYGQSAGEALGVLCQFAGPRGLLKPGARMIGIVHDDPRITDESRFRYDACVTVDGEVTTEGEIGKKQIAGGRYAVFIHQGPYETFSQTYDQIFGAWLPASGERLRDEPSFEVYLNGPGQAPPQDLRTEIWIPLH